MGHILHNRLVVLRAKVSTMVGILFAGMEDSHSIVVAPMQKLRTRGQNLMMQQMRRMR